MRGVCNPPSFIACQSEIQESGDLPLVSEVGAVLWDEALPLWNMTDSSLKMSELNQIVGHLCGVRELLGVGKTKQDAHLVSSFLWVGTDHSSRHLRRYNWITGNLWIVHLIFVSLSSTRHWPTSVTEAWYGYQDSHESLGRRCGQWTHRSQYSLPKLCKWDCSVSVSLSHWLQET